MSQSDANNEVEEHSRTEYTSSEEITDGSVFESDDVGEERAGDERAEREESTLQQSTDDVGTSADVSKETIVSSGREAFAQLVRGWDSFVQQHNNETNAFHPILKNIHSSVMDASSRLTSVGEALTHPLAPSALRHTHSTPMQRSKNADIYYGEEQEEDDLRVPIPFDPLQRSSSTPQSFRQRSVNSAFGAVESSAFSLPSQLRPLGPISETGTRSSAFDPVVQYYVRALEDMERTSIEVTDNRPNRVFEEHEIPVHSSMKNLGAASRAARFLSDVRILRRNRRRGGRENPARPASVSSKSANSQSNAVGDDAFPETSVTVITENEYSPADASIVSQNSELSDIHKQFRRFHMSTDAEFDNEKEVVTTYQQLDSDVDEETDHYQRIEASLHITESPGTVPSPSYQEMLDGPSSQPGTPPADQERHSRIIKIQVSDKTDKNIQLLRVASSQSPSQFVEGYQSSSRTNDAASASPGATTRSSNTGSSSGHTTQAASMSSVSGRQSRLSTISETDREVMEANKGGKLRRGLDHLPEIRKPETDQHSAHSSSTNSTNPHGYLALAGSPVDLREGANLHTDRFFTDPPSPIGASLLPDAIVRSHNSFSSRRSGSDNGSATNTTSSSSSSAEEPPTFVSYWDRDGSGLSSHRETQEVTNDSVIVSTAKEERDGSPAEILGYPVVFQEAMPGELATDQQPRPVWPVKLPRDKLDKFRSRPPRSPVKGGRSPMTPPPRHSVSPMLSPPRNMVNHPVSDISKPYVLRTIASGQSLTFHEDLGNTMDHMDGGDWNDTYSEKNIEIVNNDDSSSMSTRENAPSDC